MNDKYLFSEKLYFFLFVLIKYLYLYKPKTPIPLKRLIILTAIGVFFSICLQAQNFIQINKTNSGQTIQLAHDQVLEIMLPKTPSNGYTWCETNTTDKSINLSIEQIGEGDFINDDTQGEKIVGQSGTQIIRYIGASQGTAILTLELKRPWEKNNPPIDDFTITIVSGGKYVGNYKPALKVATTSHVTLTPKSIPSKWDWRSQCTPIKNQGVCGDCWAFASVATLECNIKIHDNVTRILSEEFVTDCYTQGSNGCNGGWCAHQCWVSTYKGANSKGGGAVYEIDDPTTCNGTGKTGTCSTSGYTPHETISSYAQIPNENQNGIPPDSSMKRAIYNYGPIWICIDASMTAFNNYTGGIFTYTTSTSTDHSVALVGWVDSAGVAGGGYWIMRNSWGTGWGMSGYMYISYGSALVGTYANYVVYKGGAPHNVAPVANFSEISNSSCSGTKQFTDCSFNSPTSWLWDFGDGNTSTLQNPSHSYTTNGSFTVTLKAINSYGNDTATKSISVDVDMPVAPTTTNGSGVGSVTLSASGSNTLNWYNASTGGTLVNTGSTFITPVLTDTTTYYVENDIFFPVQPVGIVSSALSSTTGGYYTSSVKQGLTFDALTPLTIKSVTVYANTTANRAITLKTPAGLVIKAYSTSIPSGKQVIPINFHVPAGIGYTLACTGSNNFWYEKSGVTYPFSVPNLLSITGNTAYADGYYFYFYDWQVQADSCTSSRTPVVATINASGIKENSITDFEIFPNPCSGTFSIQLSNQYFQNATISMINTLGEKLIEKKINNSEANTQLNVSNYQAGIYYIKLQTEKGSFVKKVLITPPRN